MMLRKSRYVAASTLLFGAAMVALANPAFAVTRTGPATPFQLEANTAYCITTDGSYAVLARCNGHDAQQWYPVKDYPPDDVSPMFQQKGSNLCLTASYYTVNSWLTIDTCHDQTDAFDGKQTFFTVGTDRANFTSVNAWSYHDAHVCFGVTSVATSQHVQMLPCDFNANKQRWDKAAS